MFNAMPLTARKSYEVSKALSASARFKELYHSLYISITTLKCRFSEY